MTDEQVDRLVAALTALAEKGLSVSVTVNVVRPWQWWRR